MSSANAHTKAGNFHPLLVAFMLLMMVDAVQSAGTTPDAKLDLNEVRAKAERGEADAQALLGFDYWDGKGVPQDYAQAYKWLNLAAGQGNNDAATVCEVAKELTDKPQPNTRTVKTDLSGTDDAFDAEKRETFEQRHATLHGTKELKDNAEGEAQAQSEIAESAPILERIMVSGICGSERRRIALINHRTFAAGEIGVISVGSEHLKIRCLEIHEKTVVIAVDRLIDRKEISLGERDNNQGIWQASVYLPQFAPLPTPVANVVEREETSAPSVRPDNGPEADSSESILPWQSALRLGAGRARIKPMHVQTPALQHHHVRSRR